MIRINNLNKFYNKGKLNQLHVLKDITLELPEKGIVALFGKSGCGKSTLFNLIGGLDKFESGSIQIDNKNIFKNTDLLRNKYIGYIFQNYYLHNNESCFDNVANSLRLCGIEDENLINELVIQALKNVGMEKYIKRTPDTLSGGQQQRIAIARAIVKNPKIILADEPTGNLDDNNTILIMDLLKEIAKDHLVLLITHEEKLVDYYCDQIINISDGQILNIRDNDLKEGDISKNKHDIYLGDYYKKELSSDNTLIEYYGNDLNSPIKMKIINDNGKIYIEFSDSNIKVIDKNSEIKLKEGKYESKKKNKNHEIVIKDIPQIEEKKIGKLFNFKHSLKNGIQNFILKKKKKLEKTMSFVLILFAIVTVIFSSIFGTAFSQLEELNRNYNHNIYYLRVTSNELSDKIYNADGKYGIEYSHVLYNQADSGYMTEFRIASFETIKTYYGNNYFNATYLSNEIIQDYQVLAGQKDDLENHEIVISSQLAEIIINESNYGNISDYDDLIGWFCPTIKVNGRSGYVAGVVKDDNKAIYMEPNVLSDILLSSSVLPIDRASKYDLKVDKGEIVFLEANNLESSIISKDVKVYINGEELVIKDIKKRYVNYQDYLSNNYPSIKDEKTYFIEKIQEKNPGLSIDEITQNYDLYIKDIKNEYYFDYIEYSTQYFDEYMNHLYFFDNSNFHIWMYLEKGIEIAKYYVMSGGILYYGCKEYKEKNGRYPTLEESEDISTTKYYEELDTLELKYKTEFYASGYNQLLKDIYLLSDEDYYLMSKKTGQTSDFVSGEMEYIPRYLLIYSSDIEETSKYLDSILEDVSYNDDYPLLISPSSSRDILLKDVRDSVIRNIISIVVLMGVMSICMYFIMKSSMMNRIKEIGIYRAIGVTKKNFVFKFVIETLVLISSTILVGYLIASCFVWFITGLTSAMGNVLYYPWYISISLIIILYIVTLGCGILPIINLLRRTPSEILSKYDI